MASPKAVEEITNPSEPKRRMREKVPPASATRWSVKLSIRGVTDELKNAYDARATISAANWSTTSNGEKHAKAPSATTVSTRSARPVRSARCPQIGGAKRDTIGANASSTPTREAESSRDLRYAGKNGSVTPRAAK